MSFSPVTGNNIIKRPTPNFGKQNTTTPPPQRATPGAPTKERQTVNKTTEVSKFALEHRPAPSMSDPENQVSNKKSKLSSPTKMVSFAESSRRILFDENESENDLMSSGSSNDLMSSGNDLQGSGSSIDLWASGSSNDLSSSGSSRGLQSLAITPKAPMKQKPTVSRMSRFGTSFFDSENQEPYNSPFTINSRSLESCSFSFGTPIGAASSSSSLTRANFDRNTGILTVREDINDGDIIIIKKGHLPLELLGKGQNQEAWKVKGKDLVIKFPLDYRIEDGAPTKLTDAEKKRIVQDNITGYNQISERLQNQKFSTLITLVKTYKIESEWRWGFTVSEYIPERATFAQVLPLLKEIVMDPSKHMGDLTPDNLHVRYDSDGKYELVIIDPYYDESEDDGFDITGGKACDFNKSLDKWMEHEDISIDQMIQMFDDVKRSDFWVEIRDRLLGLK